MAETWKAPGTCADCGGDAYIGVHAPGGSDEMICAHCYAERVNAGKATAERPPPRPIGGLQPQ